MGPLSPEALREKLSEPRALQHCEGALYAPPLAGSTLAWLAWAADDLAAVDAVIDRARRDGARSLQVGGPPGNYLVSGVDARDAHLCNALESKGFRAVGEHFDLVVATAGQRAHDDVAREDSDAALAWIAATFARAWAFEAERARAHGGLFVTRREGALAGFACHSGNRAWESTFGPIGVAERARGGGAGRRLAATVLADLAARGFDEATVPWVDAATVRFYETFCSVRSRVARVAYRWTLT